MKKPLFQALASTLEAIQNCEKSGNTEWHQRHMTRIGRLAKDNLPSGSGFDAGSGIDVDASKPNRLVLYTSFHHMNDDGYYDGWTEHTVIVTPSLAFGFDLRVTGRDRRDIKDYIAETFQYNLEQEVEEYPDES